MRGETRTHCIDASFYSPLSLSRGIGKAGYTESSRDLPEQNVMALYTGQVLQNRYDVIRLIGQGGMATVYQGADTRLGNRHVAIKEMNPANLPSSEQQWAITAFQQEAQVLARLDHPAIARVIDFFQEGTFWYLVMEYVAGEALDMALHRFPRGLAEEQVLNWASQLGSALDYLHQRYPPIIFRDLKPANVMVQPDGTLKLIDFGIARYFKAGQTHDTVRLGTAGYAAPEQYGRGQTDARSDVFSLGVLLHQLLTGCDPTRTPLNLPPIRSFRPDVSTRVVQAVEQAMRPDPSQRYASVRDFAAALGISISGFLAPPYQPSPPPSIPLLVRLKRLPLLTLVGMGTLGGAFLFLLVWFVLSLGDGGVTVAAGTPATPTPIVIEVTQIVTLTPDINDGSVTAATSDPGPTQSLPPTESAPTLTNTPIPPTLSPTRTPLPPTKTLSPSRTPSPIPTPSPTQPSPTPVQVLCSYSVFNSFANTYQSYQTLLGCPNSNSWATWSAIEPFQRGFMLWREDNDKIYVLYNDGRWARYDDIWVEGDLEYSCGTQQSPPTPRRGFGKIWCTVSGVQQGLGNATAGEEGEDTTTQSFTNGLIWQTSVGRFVLFNDGSWRR